MNTTLLLNKARKEVERAKTQAATDAKAARLARQLARAAKFRLKQARRLSKMVKKSARRAEEKSKESSQTLESAQAKLENLQRRISKEQRKNKSARRVRRSKPVQKAFPKPKLARSNGGLPRSRAKSKPSKTTEAPTPQVSPTQSRQTTKPAARRTHGTAEATPKAVVGKPASAVASEPKPVPAVGQKLGDLNPLPAPDVDAPSSSGQEPTND